MPKGSGRADSLGGFLYDGKTLKVFPSRRNKDGADLIAIEEVSFACGVDVASPSDTDGLSVEKSRKSDKPLIK